MQWGVQSGVAGGLQARVAGRGFRVLQKGDGVEAFGGLGR